MSSSEKAYGLVRAQKHQVDSMVLPSSIEWTKLHNRLLNEKVEMIFLAGFMKILPASFIKEWEGRIFNIHPSLLPRFKGLKAIEQAFKAHEDVGVTIHHVVPQVDAGEIVLQELAVPKEELQQMDLEEVTQRTHAKEHELVARWIGSFT